MIGAGPANGTGESRRPASQAQRNARFAMVPEVVTASGLSDAAVRLYAFVDQRSGSERRYIVKGCRWVAQQLGWYPQKVTKVARELARAGLIELEECGTGGARQQTRMRV